MPINFTFSDTLKKDKFNAWTGIGQNNGSSLIIGETTINGTINGFNYSSYKTGNYGILYAKSGDINTKPAYRYEPNNDAINALENNTTESFYFSGDGDIDAINMDFVAVNDSPILNTLSSTKFTDNASFNNFTNRMGKLVATDAEQSVITYGIVGGVVSETISTLNDIYGVLTVDIVTGNYTFKTDDVAINALDSTQKHTIVFTASDGNETTSTNWVFNLQGANDTPIITTLQSITFIDTLTNDKPTSKTGIIVASDAEKSPLNFSLNESINVTFLENDITYDLAKTHLAGVFYLNSTTGEYLYVPDKIKINALDVDNLDTFTITVSDGFLSATTSLTLDIQATNDIPIFQKPDSIVLNDTRFADTFTIQTSDLKATDAENANLLYSISGGTIFGDISTLTNSYGTLFVNTATGNYRFEPNKSAINALNTNQSAHFLLSVSDGHLEDIENLYLTINAVNDAPQLTAEPAIFVDGVENTNYEIKTTDLLEGYSDAENDSFFVSELTTNHGVVIKNQHDWLFTPELNYSGDVTMTYTITDTHGDSTIATQHFQLLPLNFAPTLTGEKVNFPNTFKNNSVLLKNQDLLQGFSDKDNDVLSILNLVVNNGHISQIGHDWLFTPQTDFTGIINLSYQISDGKNGITDTSQHFSIIDLPKAKGVQIDKPFRYDINADFTNKTGTINLENLPTWLKFNAKTGTLTGTPTINDIETFLIPIQRISDNQDLQISHLGLTVALFPLGDLQFSTHSTDSKFGTKALDSVSYHYASHAVDISLNNVQKINLIENVIGTEFDDKLTGNKFANVLDGGNGADTMMGGLGSDVYVVNHVNDVVIEARGIGTGTDTVFTTLNYIAPDNIEKIVLFGSADLTVSGNNLSNTIIGNSGNNVLFGNRGDWLKGGLGNDTYFLDSSNLTVSEFFKEGIDSVHVNNTYTLPKYVENLTLTGAKVSNGFGNAANNSLMGNDANNQLIGFDGDDVLNGGLGADILIGGKGKDIFQFNTSLNSANVDKINDFVSGVDKIALSQTIFNALTIGTLPTNEIGNHILYDKKSGILSYDADGSENLHSPIQIALLGVSTSHPALIHTDFVIA